MSNYANLRLFFFQSSWSSFLLYVNAARVLWNEAKIENSKLIICRLQERDHWNLISLSLSHCLSLSLSLSQSLTLSLSYSFSLVSFQLSSQASHLSSSLQRLTWTILFLLRLYHHLISALSSFIPCHIFTFTNCLFLVIYSRLFEPVNLPSTRNSVSRDPPWGKKSRVPSIRFVSASSQHARQQRNRISIRSSAHPQSSELVDH